jgi:hypothetical protein
MKAAFRLFTCPKQTGPALVSVEKADERLNWCQVEDVQMVLRTRGMNGKLEEKVKLQK